MMTAFSSSEFRKMVDLEISYVYSIQNKMDRIYEEGLAIIALVDMDLKTN
ncbi:MAG: hypothetical protein WBM98_18260 [Maribacter sp.]